LSEAAENLAKAPDQPEEAPRKKRKPPGGLECQIGLLIGIAGLIGSRLGQLWIAFDVFSQFTLQFAVVAFAFLVGLLMPRAKLFAAFLVLVLGILGIGLWPHLASRAPMVLGTAGPGEKLLRVASFNTFFANQQVDEVEAEIRRLDADVITLLEMGPNKRRILASLKDIYPHQADCYAIDYCNLALLSKLPIAESDARALWEGAPYIRVKLGPEAGGLTVIGLHTIRFPHSRAQFRQATEMGNLIEHVPGMKLVMGDFNATPFSRVIATIERRGSLRRLTNLPTWPGQFGLPQIAIDHILVSAGITPIESEAIGEPAGSDHFPITMKIAIPVSP
jgi:endonuclease/exonuclease/phosphatase (EEP) superfamily protein YafD